MNINKKQNVFNSIPSGRRKGGKPKSTWNDKILAKMEKTDMTYIEWIVNYGIITLLLHPY